eukprot:2926358-Rhodomonas_salina.2
MAAPDGKGWAGEHMLQKSVRCGQESTLNEKLTLNADGTADYLLSVNHVWAGESKTRKGTWQEVSADEVKVIWTSGKSDASPGCGSFVGKVGELESPEEVVYTRAKLFGPPEA